MPRPCCHTDIMQRPADNHQKAKNVNTPQRRTAKLSNKHEKKDDRHSLNKIAVPANAARKCIMAAIAKTDLFTSTKLDNIQR